MEAKESITQTALVGEPPTHSSASGEFHRISETERRRIMAKAHEASKKPEPPEALQRYRLEPANDPDDEAVTKAAQKTIKSIDPLWPITFALWAEIEVPAAISYEGKPLGTLVDAGVGLPFQLGLIPEALQLLLDNVGIDDDLSIVDERFESEGEAAMREVLSYDAPKSQLQKWRRELDARLALAESIGRWYGMRPEAIAAVTCRPYTAKKTLHFPGGKAKSLSLALAKAEAEAERKRAALAAQFEDEHRPNKRTLADLGLVGLLCDLSAFEASVPPSLRSVLPTHIVPEIGRYYYAFRNIPGAALPEKCEFAGCCSVLDSNTVIQVTPARAIEDIREATDELFALVIALRQRFVRNIDRGAIASNRWTDEGIPVAQALLERYGHALQADRLGLHWVLRYVPEAIVRGCLVRPDVAIDLVWSFLTAGHAEIVERTRPRMPKHARKLPQGPIDPTEQMRPHMNRPPGTQRENMVPVTDWVDPGPAPALSREFLEKYAVEAATRGEMGAGSLLVTKESTGKNEKRGHKAP